MTVKCYAACLGECGSKQSIEHYVPKGIWNNPILTFEGLDWSKGETKSLPVKRVGLKILCKSHNEMLSGLDSETRRFFRTLEKVFNNLHERRDAKRSEVWKVDREIFNGHTLEKLFAKMATGVINEQPHQKWHLTSTSAIEPPCEIVETIYGLREFEAPMGLYFVNAVGDQIYNQDHVHIRTLFHPDNGYIGAIIGLRQMQFFINLSDINPDDYTMLSATNVPIGKDGSPHTYRIQTLNFDAPGKLSGRITFDW